MTNSFNRIASFIIASQLDPNSNTDLKTAAEIVASSIDGNTLIYSNSPQGTIGFVDITDPSAPVGLGEIEVGGEPTSVTVKDNYALVAVNTSADFINPSGQLVAVNITTQELLGTTWDLGGQPDSIAVSPDGNYAVIAIENERDEDLGDGAPPQLPEGFVVIVDTSDADPNNWTTSQVTLTGLAGVTFPEDPEPEFVDISENNIAAVTLQENNAIVLIDLATVTVINSFSAGTVDLTGIDTEEEDPAIIDQTSSLTAVPREPDGITFIGTDYIATADEGDLDGGSRGFTIFNLDGNVVFTSGNTMDQLTAQFGHYPDARSENKGNEPENIEFATYNGTDYLFVNSERSSLVFVYNVDDPTNPVFEQVLPAGVAPEGGKAIPERDLLVVASEEDDRDAKIRSVLNIYEYDADGTPAYPTLQSEPGNPPIPWSAMSGLAAGAGDILYAVEDSFYASNRFFTIDTSTTPATLTDATTIKDTNDVFAALRPDLVNADTDKTINIDPEGIAATGDGFLWIASEGAGAAGDDDQILNYLFKVDATTGTIAEVITLPDEINANQIRFGLEGVAYDDGKLVTILQRAWTGDPNPRVLVYDTNTSEWVGDFFYPLDPVESQNGGWVGLSDISPLGDDKYLVLERDNQGGPDAAIKRLYTIDLSGDLADGTTLEKTFVRDLMPDFLEAGGLMPEKLEGLAVTDNGVWVINDNDGVDDNSGETQLINVGLYAPKISEIQGAGHTSPLVGQSVIDVAGIVTAVDSNGFYFQDPNPDDDIATSEALFVFTGGAPTVAVGDSITVSGTISEFTPGGTSTRNLSTTQIAFPDTVTVLSSGNPLPEAIIIGGEGRIPPTENIDDDAFDTFDPETSGIDFFESLEAMRVTGTDLVAVAGTNRFGEIFTITGDNATGLSERGTLNISPDDFNPERIQVNYDSGIFEFEFPDVNVGDFLGDVTGVLGYNFGNFEIFPTEDFTANIVPAGLTPEVSAIAPNTTKLTVASYNVLNLEPNDEDGDTDVADGRFTAIAEQIVNSLNAPDIIGLQEIQDNSGSADDGVVAADQTLQALVDAIAAAGGPTYSFIDNTFITDEASGGQPGGNIRTAYLYNPSRVDLVDGSVQTISGQGEGEAFEGGRLPLVATFTFNGEEVTIVNNHFSSKGGSAAILGVEQPFEERQEEADVNGSLDERQAQSAAVQAFVSDALAADSTANIVVLGDFNEFEFVSPLTGLEEAGLTNLTNNLPEDERYTFIFQGNSQSLDHILVSESLAGGAEFDIVNVNSEFVETDARASDHDPLVARLDVQGDAVFTLELLHLADQEPLNAGGNLTDITGLSAVLNALQAQDLGNDGIEDNTLILSSGDATIPGLFYSASEAAFGSRGIADIQIQNELGVQAIAFGNHEFDFGTGEIASLIDGSAEGDFSALTGTALEGQDFTGTNFPYLSTNLDFSTDENLARLEVEGGQAPQPNAVTSSTVIDVNGESIGVVGATTPTLATISSPGDVGISPSPFGSNPTEAELDALAAEIQAEVDALLAANPRMNKVVLLAHMQRLSIEEALATRLENVDIIVGGGSNTRLFDENDRVRAGDSDQGEYPKFFTNAGGTQTALVNTDGSYKYLGRLVLEFDPDGNIIPESYDATVSGAYATDAQGVADLNAEGLVDPEIQAIVDAIEAEIIATESNVFGLASVFLNGNRSGTGTADDPDGVRTQETNLGNLTADANLAAAKEVDETVLVSIKNGGGIRASIGETNVPPGGSEAVRSPNSELVDSEGNVVKPEGGISQNDITTTLAFNNGLTLLTLTKQELVDVLEHGVSALPGAAGQFPQIAGVKFSFDATQEEGSQIQNAGIFDEDDNLIAELVRDGELVGDPNQTFRIVTLGFLADGGDSYPFPTGESANRVDLVQEGVQTGDATFADDGTEQDALAEYLLDNFAPDSENIFAQEDVGPALDERIQNLAFRDDTVLEGDSSAGEIDLEDSDEEQGVIALTNALLLAFQATTTNTSFVNELVVFQVADSAGNVVDANGETVSPGTESRANYLSAILNASTTQVVISSLDGSDNLPNGFSLEGLSSELLVNSSTQLGFMLVVDGTLDDLKAGEDLDVFLSTQAGEAELSINDGGFSITFGDDGGLDDLVFEVTTSEFDSTVDVTTEGTRVGRNVSIADATVEAIDLGLQTLSLVDGDTNLAEGDSVNVSITLFREAAFDNLLGFYVADEITGAVTDADGNTFAPTDDRLAYAQAAYNNAVANGATFEPPANESTVSIELPNLVVGNLILPFIISNSDTPASDFSNVYFPFLELNYDRVDHIRLLGNGVFGFEDLPGGGDQDFDDIIAFITSVVTV